MKKVVKYLFVLLLIGLIISILWRCSTVNTPPSYQYVSKCFQDDKKDIFLIKEYLINSDYTNIYINEDCKTALADLEHIKISDEIVIEALQRLKEKGYEGINKFGKTIEFRVWDGIRDIRCGIAFVSKGSEIDIQFITETRTLTQNEWYYYVSDYNEWRNR